MFNSSVNTVLSLVRNSSATKAAQAVLRAQAWYENEPYDGNDPDYVMGDDKPRVISPLPRMLIDKAAGLLFGKVPQLTADDDALQTWMTAVWKKNKLAAKLLGWGRVNAYAGAGWLKFVHNPDTAARNPWPIQYYHQGYVTPRYSRAFPDELESIAITYRETGDNGKETWYREEWTLTEYKEWSGIPSTVGRLPEFDKITPTDEKPNTYGCIPLVNWPNIYDPELDPGAGRGDMDGLYSVLHRVNIVADDYGLALQLDAKGSWLAFGVAAGGIDLTPGSVNVASNKDAFVKAVESGKPQLNDAQAFLKQLEAWVFNAARIVYLDPKEISLGQLSSLAIRLVYGPSIELTEEKRRNAGEAIEELIEKMARAAKKMGIESGLPAEPDIELAWPELFNLTQAEIAEAQTNLMQAEQAGWLTAQEARQKAATLHGIRHTDQRDSELDSAQDERLKEALNGAGQTDEDLEGDPDPAAGGKAPGRGQVGFKAPKGDGGRP